MIKYKFYKICVILYVILLTFYYNTKVFAVSNDKNEDFECLLGTCKNVNIMGKNTIANISIHKQHPFLYCENTEIKEIEQNQQKIKKIEQNWNYFIVEVDNGEHPVHKTINSYITLYEYLQRESINNSILTNYLLNQGELLLVTYDNINSLSNKYINNILNQLQQNNKKLTNISQSKNIWNQLLLYEKTHENLVESLKKENINISAEISTNIKDNILIIEEGIYLTPSINNKYGHQCGNDVACILKGEKLEFEEQIKKTIHNFTNKITEVSIQSQYQRPPSELTIFRIINSIIDKIITDKPLIDGIDKLGHFLNINLREVRKLVEDEVESNYKYISSLGNLSNMERIAMFKNKYKETEENHINQYNVNIFFKKIFRNIYSPSETAKYNMNIATEKLKKGFKTIRQIMNELNIHKIANNNYEEEANDNA